MHGELRKIRCQSCGVILEWDDDLGTEDSCPACNTVGGLRPHIVWFGEMPLEMDRIYEELDRCALFMSIGTSGNVYPAAGFVQHVRMYTQAHSVELNLEPSTGASIFVDKIYGPATEVVPSYVDKLLTSGL